MLLLFFLLQDFLSDPLPFRASSCPQPVSFPQKHILWRSVHPAYLWLNEKQLNVTWSIFTKFLFFSSRPRTSSLLWGRKVLRWGSCRRPLRPLSWTCDGWRITWTRCRAGYSVRRRRRASTCLRWRHRAHAGVSDITVTTARAIKVQR